MDTSLLGLLDSILSCKTVSLARIQLVFCSHSVKVINPILLIWLRLTYISIIIIASYWTLQQTGTVLCLCIRNSSLLKVFCRLQKLMFCMSADSTLKLIKSIGSSHDVLQWRDQLHCRFEQSIIEVCIVLFT